MRAVVQRVAGARVLVEGETVGEVEHGLCVLLGVADGDDQAVAARLAGKVARLRIFENEEGKFDRSVVDKGGGVLVVSQFTLIADTAKGNRPSFAHAAPPEVAEALYEAFCDALAGEGAGRGPRTLRRPHGGRDRQRRAGHDRPRCRRHESDGRQGAAAILTPDISPGLEKWARGAHFLREGSDAGL